MDDQHILKVIRPIVVDLERRLNDSRPIVIPSRPLDDILHPLIKSLENEIALIKNARAGLDIESIVKRVAEIVKADLKIKHTFEIKNTVDMPSLNTYLAKQLIPAPKETNLENYKPHDQAKSGEANYFGFVDQTGSWYIMRQAGKIQRYAAGTDDYDFKWSRRQDLSYRTLDKALNG